MAFDGNGIFSLPSPQFPFIPDTVISAEDVNVVLSEIASAVSLAITKDGVGKPTATISWNGQKLSNLGNGAADSEAVNYGQVFKKPVFTEPKAQASPALNDNSLLLATTEWVRTLAFQSGVPGVNLPANAGKVLTSNGVSGEWASLDSRGHTWADKGNSGAVPVALDFSVSENPQVTVTGATTISVTGWPAGRTGVMLLDLVNGGSSAVTFQGINWPKIDGAHTANFADLNTPLQANGTDHIIIVGRAGVTPWAKLVR